MSRNCAISKTVVGINVALTVVYFLFAFGLFLPYSDYSLRIDYYQYLAEYNVNEDKLDSFLVYVLRLLFDLTGEQTYALMAVASYIVWVVIFPLFLRNHLPKEAKWTFFLSLLLILTHISRPISIHIHSSMAIFFFTIGALLFSKSKNSGIILMMVSLLFHLQTLPFLLLFLLLYKTNERLLAISVLLSLFGFFVISLLSPISAWVFFSKIFTYAEGFIPADYRKIFIENEPRRFVVPLIALFSLVFPSRYYTFDVGIAKHFILIGLIIFVLAIGSQVLSSRFFSVVTPLTLLVFMGLRLGRTLNILRTTAVFFYPIIIIASSFKIRAI